MSAENREVVRSVQLLPDADVLALLTDDKAEGMWIDQVGPFFDPSFQGTIRFPGMAPVAVVGLDGLREVWRGWMSHWASFRVEIEDPISAGAFVVQVFRTYGRRHPDAPEEALRTCLNTSEGRISASPVELSG